MGAMRVALQSGRWASREQGGVRIHDTKRLFCIHPAKETFAGEDPSLVLLVGAEPHERSCTKHILSAGSLSSLTYRRSQARRPRSRTTLPHDQTKPEAQPTRCALDDEGQLRSGHGTRPPLPVRADGAGADLGLAI
jgi:hypothetical protein